MRLRSVSFATWCANHEDSHQAKWCRELYPWDVLEQVDFDQSLLGIPQQIVAPPERFVVTLKERHAGAAGRINWLLHILSPPAGEKKRWSHRSWDNVLQLVASSDGHFITVFAKAKDPSKIILERFFAGTLACDEFVRSIPVSAMLFRSLVSYAAEDIFGSLDRGFPTAAARDGSQAWLPFLSRGRDLWIACAFTEEKAHRIGIKNVGAADQLLVVYSQPTFSRHHRCNAPNVRILSLQEFLSIGSRRALLRYIPQARLLLNHLRDQTLPDHAGESSSALLCQIGQATRSPRIIETSELREARAGLGITISTSSDVAYVCACGNLVNAAMNPKLGLYSKSIELSKDVYSFKSILGRALENAICMNIPDVAIHVAQDGVVYVRVHGLQFSFHAIPRLPQLEEFATSEHNRRQEWSGLRLQPIAPLVLEWARALMSEQLVQQQLR